ncbi:MAG: helix-turn-helix transcriptional regulator [Firmicutes bacterium]|nr:helix-turn-helix transcriptional regulator [Bacillota bacterium]
MCHCHDRRGQPEGLVAPALLLLLLEKPGHGYDLVDRLARELDLTDVDPGGVYRHLRRIEEEGFLESTWEAGGPGPARRVYRLTPEGREFLDLWARAVRRQRQVLDRFLERYEAAVREGRADEDDV